MKLTALEEQILTKIAETHPYTFFEVKKVYFRCQSFDKTIEVLNKANAHCVHWEVILKQENN